MQHVMLDLETLGTTADAVIMSIGAVRFDVASDKIDDEGFYASVSVESNLDLKRRISEDTLIWWMDQSPAARKVFSEEKTTLEAALEDLSLWIGDDWEKTEVWSNGATFDIPMLDHAFRQLGWETPWKFWNTRCYRTYANQPLVLAAGIKKPKAQHNALLDAVDQANTLQQMYAVINGKPGSALTRPKVKA